MIGVKHRGKCWLSTISVFEKKINLETPTTHALNCNNFHKLMKDLNTFEGWNSSVETWANIFSSSQDWLICFYSKDVILTFAFTLTNCRFASFLELVTGQFCCSKIDTSQSGEKGACNNIFKQEKCRLEHNQQAINHDRWWILGVYFQLLI